MSTKTAVIANIRETEKFYNVETNEGVTLGIGKDKNPILSKQLATAKAGDEITYTPWEKEGKHYAFDPKAAGAKGGFGGKSFVPKDKKFEAAQVCIQAAAATHSLTKDVTPEKVMETAEKYLAWVMSKSATPAQPANN